MLPVLPARLVHRARSLPSRLRTWPHRLGADAVDTALARLGWLGVLVFLALVVVPGLLPSRVFLATDLLSVMDPWAVADGNEVTNRLSWDTIDSATPMAVLIVESVRSGDIPLWDPYTNGGTTLAALPNSGLLSPLSLPWWVLPPTAATAGVKILEVAAAALGMNGLLRRRWGLPRLTVPLATLVYATSGFMVAWTNWPQTRVAAMIPLLFWATDRLAVERRWRDVLPGALVIASMLLGGFPAIVVYSLLTAAGYLLVRALAHGLRPTQVAASLLRSAAGVLLGAGLAAVQLLPFVWQSLHYINFESRTAENTQPLPLQSLASALVPSLLGDPAADTGRWIAHPVEGFSYIGAAALVLVSLALLVTSRRRPPRGVLPFLITALVVLLVAVYLGGPLLRLLQEVPGVGSSPIGRMRSVLGFLVAVLAACGLAAVYEAEGLRAQLGRLWGVARPVRSRVVAGGALVVAAGLMGVMVVLAVRYRDPQDAQTSWRLIGTTLVLMGVCTAAAGLAWVLPRRSTAVLAVVVALVLTTLTSVDTARRWWPLSDSDTFYARTPTHELLEDRLDGNRYVSVYTAMMPGTSTLYRQRALSGHAFVSPQWRETMSQVEDGFFQTSTYSMLPVGSLLDGADSGVLDRYAARYVVAPMSEYFPGQREEGAAATEATTLRADGMVLASGSFAGAVRGIVVTASSYESLETDDGLLTVRILSDDDGSVLATSTSDIDGAPGLDGYVAVAGEDIPDNQPWHAEVALTQTEGSLDLGTRADGTLALDPYRPLDDGLRLVHAGDAIVLERLSALDRVRWASTQTVVEDEQERLAVLEEGELAEDTVVLEDASDVQAMTEGTSATVTEKDLGTDTVELAVDSDGPGWVVIADPLRDGGWQATLDGRQVELVEADNAAVAVYVPQAGNHTIRLDYTAPWLVAGLLVTGFSWAVVLVACLPGLLRRARAVASVVPVRARRKQAEASQGQVGDGQHHA
ncbi:hypothetical protein D4740_09025 [Actinomyces sp. 2119]|uniref:YfhO family protein n=1 Tax=Actinomyces sp. 2119 TaxID=2321393 RepID=UPI000E6B957F|nr:YfhO family protein [Actinomyces sp. 2119]RJF41520.1 hypothetical protein D4740_09025 [Actinomyces sp. 2119]